MIQGRTLASKSLGKPERSKKRTASAPVSLPSESASKSLLIQRAPEGKVGEPYRHYGRYIALKKLTRDITHAAGSEVECYTAHKVGNKLRC